MVRKSYDRFPINVIDTKRLSFFLQNGDFITCICITKQFGGDRNIEYIAYSLDMVNMNVLPVDAIFILLRIGVGR